MIGILNSISNRKRCGKVYVFWFGKSTQRKGNKTNVETQVDKSVDNN